MIITSIEGQSSTPQLSKMFVDRNETRIKSLFIEFSEKGQFGQL